MMYQLPRHYLFYKPFQTLCQFSASEGKKTLKDYLGSLPKDVYPVGRLDYDSEGLLLLTNDKTVNRRLLNPRQVQEKEYWVQVEGVPDTVALQKLSRGVIINAKGKSLLTRPAKAALLPTPEVAERHPPIRFRKNIPTCWLSLVITEGKNRQVRKMTAAVGFPTLRLIRFRIGQMTLQGMQPGDWRSLTPPQLSRLLSRS